MSWQDTTTAVEFGDPVLVFYRDVLTEKIRDHFSELDRVAVLWRRSQQWIPTPIGIALPAQKNLRDKASPEEGAARLCERAFAFAEENNAKILKFEGYGSSKSGQTSKRLFSLQVRPDRGEPLDEEDSKKSERSSAIEAAHAVREALVSVAGMLDKSHAREMLTVDKLLAMADRQTSNTSAVIYGLMMDRQMRVDQMEHEAEMQDQRLSHETTERFLEMVGKPFGDAFEKFLARAFGLEDEAFNGKTFARRLGAIVHGVANQPDGESRLKRASELLGEDAWKVLQAMSNAESDQAFIELGKKFVEVVGPDGKDKMRLLAEILGPGAMHALLRLFDDAGLVE